jgi:DNA-binding transcriptional LysR family regulator
VDVAICVDSVGASGMSVEPLGDEPMVIVPRLARPLGRREREATLDTWTVEERSLTWTSLEPRLRRRHQERRGGIALRITGRVESFAALVQLARAGHCHALVPRGIAVALGVPSRVLLPLPGLERPIAAVTRKRALERTALRAFVAALRAEVLKPRGSR